jgi:hypothetical protein
MADNAFDFPQAPTGSRSRQFGAVAGLAGLVRAVSGGRKNDGMSPRAQSNLMRQKAGHEIDSQLISHVLGENAADAAHKRTLAQNRQAHKLNVENRADVASHIIGNVPTGHVATSISVPGGSGTYKPIPEKPASPSVSLETPTTKGPQFRARG